MAQTVNLEKTRFLSPPPKSPETGFFAKSTAQTVNLEKTRFLSPPPESPLSFPERSRRVEGSKWTFRLRSMSKAPWRLLYQTANLEKTRFLSPPPESPETGFFAKSTAQTVNLEKTRFLNPTQISRNRVFRKIYGSNRKSRKNPVSKPHPNLQKPGFSQNLRLKPQISKKPGFFTPTQISRNRVFRKIYVSNPKSRKNPVSFTPFTYPKEQTNDKSTTRKKRMASPSWRFR